jgi:hypothetical protein
MTPNPEAPWKPNKRHGNYNKSMRKSPKSFNTALPKSFKKNAAFRPSYVLKLNVFVFAAIAQNYILHISQDPKSKGYRYRAPILESPKAIDIKH